MRFGLGLTLIIAITATIAQTAMACEPDDFICQKFKRIQAEKKQARRRAISRRSASRRRPTRPPRTVRAEPARENLEEISPASQQAAQVQTSMVRDIIPTKPAIEISRLEPGEVIEPPRDMTNLVFATNDQLEITAAQCRPTGPQVQNRISCAIAVHRTRLNSDAGEGCSGSLGLSRLEFVRSGNGQWTNEDSIALCGGRLLRRSVLYPIALNGEPAYGLTEEYELIGGDRTCAAPYLASRQPLQKSYLPRHRGSQRNLNCGMITADR